jgi:hypothetical protein
VRGPVDSLKGHCHAEHSIYSASAHITAAVVGGAYYMIVISALLESRLTKGITAVAFTRRSYLVWSIWTLKPTYSSTGTSESEDDDSQAHVLD